MNPSRKIKNKHTNPFENGEKFHHMTNPIINKEIIKLWDRYSKSVRGVYAPLFYGEFRHGGILFIGMNPAFSEQALRRFLRNTTYQDIDPITFFAWDNVRRNIDANISKYIQIEGYAVERLQFFKRMREIVEEVGVSSWRHIDLFLYRETSQNAGLTRVMENIAQNELNGFGKEQLEIFRKVLLKIEPQVIVVSNARASDIIRKYMQGDISKFDERRGFHFLHVDRKRIPIFFSSMLSGMRALDTGSRERLKWHIKQALRLY